MRGIIGFAGLWILASLPQASADDTAVTATPITLDQAAAHYQSGDFEAARKEFYELAKAGIWTAYVNLGAMALNGQGMRSDPGEAFGWFKSAEELGPKVPDNWVTKLDAAITSSQRQAAAAIVVEFGRRATIDRIAAKLQVCVDGSAPGDPSRLVAPKRIAPENPPAYPIDAERSGRQGILIVSALIAPDGRAKDLRIEQMIPPLEDDGFADASLMWLQHARYEPATSDGKYAPARLRHGFRFGMNQATGLWNDAYLKSLKSTADGGHPGAQHAVAYLAWMSREAAEILQFSCSDAARMAVSAALGGVAEAGFWVSRGVRKNDAASAQLSDAWLRDAGRDLPRAQLELALQLLERSDPTQHTAEIRQLLTKAAAGKDAYVQKRAAFLLATVPVPEARDTSAALELAQRLKPEYSSNPELDVVLAAAQAAAGDFADAIRTQQRAIKKAARLSWDTSALQEMLIAYQEGRFPDHTSFYLSWSDEKTRDALAQSLREL